MQANAGMITSPVRTMLHDQVHSGAQDENLSLVIDLPFIEHYISPETFASRNHAYVSYSSTFLRIAISRRCPGIQELVIGGMIFDVQEKDDTSNLCHLDVGLSGLKTLILYDCQYLPRRYRVRNPNLSTSLS